MSASVGQLSTPSVEIITDSRAAPHQDSQETKARRERELLEVVAPVQVSHFVPRIKGKVGKIGAMEGSFIFPPFFFMALYIQDELSSFSFHFSFSFFLCWAAVASIKRGQVPAVMLIVLWTINLSLGPVNDNVESSRSSFKKYKIKLNSCRTR